MTASRDRRLVRAAPCAKCPFRNDVPIYLRRDRRREIRDGLLDGDGGFACHETTTAIDTADGTEMITTDDSQQCAGAIKSILKAGRDSNNIRVMARLGLLAPDTLEASGADVWDINDWVAANEFDTAAAQQADRDVDVAPADITRIASGKDEP